MVKRSKNTKNGTFPWELCALILLLVILGIITYHFGQVIEWTPNSLQN